MTTQGAPADPAEEGSIGALLGAAAVIGVAAGIGVVAFLAVEHDLSNLLWEDIPDRFGWDEVADWWVYAVLMFGAVAVWGALKLPGHGGHRPLDGLGFDVGPRQIASVVLAAMASLSIGAVVGPEAPLMAVGSAIAAALATRASPAQRQVLMLAGATSAITLILGNPLVAGVLVLEISVLKGSPGGRTMMLTLLPVLLAMGTGYVLQVGVGDWQGVGESQLALPGLPAYDQVAWIDLALVLPVGLLVGGLGVAAVYGGHAVQRLAVQRPLPVIVAAGFVVASIAVAVRAITGEPLDAILFSGQTATDSILAITSVSTLLIIAVGKTVAYGVSVGSGFRGGLIFPAMFLGVTVGSIVDLLVGSASESALAAAGIASAVGALMRMPFTAVLLAFLLCSSAGFAVTTPAILGAVLGVLLRVVADARLGEPGVKRAPSRPALPAH